MCLCTCVKGILTSVSGHTNTMLLSSLLAAQCHHFFQHRVPVYVCKGHTFLSPFLTFCVCLSIYRYIYIYTYTYILCYYVYTVLLTFPLQHTASNLCLLLSSSLSHPRSQPPPPPTVMQRTHSLPREFVDDR